MQKLTITKIYKSNTDKQGNLLKTRDGRNYTRLAFQCQEYGTAWISGFENPTTSQWREGDQVEVIIEKVQKDQNEYLNFKLPQAFKVTEDMWKSLMERVAKLEFGNISTNEPEVGGHVEEYPEENNNPENIPF